MKNIYSCEKLHKKLLPPELPFLIFKCAPNRLLAGALPQTPLGELTAEVV